MTTAHIPTASLAAWWLGTNVNAMLLDSAVTSIPSTAATRGDLAGYEIASGGGYTSSGIDMPDLTLNLDSLSRTIEWGRSGATWTSAGTYSPAAFRIAVLTITSASNGRIVAYHDFGSAQNLTADPLAIPLTASTRFPGTYVVIREVAV
jgi:hypothetical protein